MTFSPSRYPLASTVGLWFTTVLALHLLKGLLDGMAEADGFVLGFLAVSAAAIGVCVIIAHDDRGPRHAVSGVLGGVLLIFAGPILGGGIHSLSFFFGAGALFLSARIGVALGRRAPAARSLWPLIIVAVAITLWTALTPTGFDYRLLFDRPPKSTLPMTMLVVPFPGVNLEATLGLADVLFIGLLIGLVRRFALPMGRALFGLGVGLGVALTVHLSTAVLLPALVFVGPATALALGATVKPRGAEVTLALVFVPIVWGLGALIAP